MTTMKTITALSPTVGLPTGIAETSKSVQASFDTPLTDGFQRQLSYLRLSITDFCNFRCHYCLPNGYTANGGKRPDNELTLPEIRTLLQGFSELGTKKVRLTGGEPSIRHDLPDIIALSKATCGIDTVALSSNGYKLAKHLADWQAAGLDKLNLSVDSFDPVIFKQITGFDMLPTLLSDIDKLLATTDIELKLNGILMAETAYDTLKSALTFIKERPVTYRFIEFMQTSDNSDLFFAEHTTSQSIKTYLNDHGWQAKARTTTAGPATEYSHPDYVGGIGLIEPYAPKFCDSCNRLRVSSQGKVHLCLFDKQNHDIRPYLQGDVAGLKQSIQALMPVKPEHHYLTDNDSGMMANLSMVGG